MSQFWRKTLVSGKRYIVAATVTSLAAGPYTNREQRPRYNIACAEKDVRENRNIRNVVPSAASSVVSSNSDENSLAVNENDSRDDYENPDEIIQCDFLILGQGSAGRAARMHFEKYIPDAKIVVVDPLLNFAAIKRPSENKQPNVHSLIGSAIGICPAEKTVKVRGLRGKTISVNYQTSCLIATGVRGACPPESLFESESLSSRVLELRPTVMPTYLQPHESSRARTSTRPAVGPAVVRNVASLAITEGARVCILGSGLEALGFAVHINTKLKKNIDKNKKGEVTLVFGNSGVLNSRLPRYLRSALLKRLKGKGILLDEQSLVRYVSRSDDVDTNKTENQSSLEIFTGKTYDSLDTMRHFADILVVAPSVEDYQGNAMIWTRNGPNTWSQVCSKGGISCYSKDGRIVVNAQLNATEGVYAAGSVARHPHPRSGRATVCGEGPTDSYDAGVFAAEQMSKAHLTKMQERTYYKKLYQSKDVETGGRFIFCDDRNFPIWRSDLQYNGSEEVTYNHSLNSIGINMLCVGRCDADMMSTHGYWWTNRSSGDRIKRRKSLTSLGKKNMPLATSGRRYSKHSSRPVYGVGVVYYFEKDGRLGGIMSWGLPYITSEDGCLNENLLQRMTHILHTNGIALANHDDLSSEDLSKETIKLLRLATNGNMRLSCEVFSNDGSIARPLHLYSHAKPKIGFRLGWMKAESHHSDPESIYFKDSTEDELYRPPSLIKVFPMENMFSNWLSPDYGSEDSGNEEAISKSDENDTNENLGRPLEEDPLWLRRKEASRNRTKNEIMFEAYRHNIGTAGARFYDGRPSHRWI